MFAVARAGFARDNSAKSISGETVGSRIDKGRTPGGRDALVRSFQSNFLTLRILRLVFRKTPSDSLLSIVGRSFLA